MAIAVMGDDDESTSSLILRLGRLGFDAIHARRESGAFARVLEAADIVVCSSIEAATVAIDAAGRLPAPFLLLAPVLPDAEEMLDAMRRGFIDMVRTPVADTDLGARIRAGLARARPNDLRIAGQLDSLQRDQRAARYVQQRMLPPSPLAIDRYRLAHRVQPSLLLSGDFVDYFRMGDRHFAFYIADVSGHGASSAIITVILKTFFRRLRHDYRRRMLKNPGDILTLLNRELLDQGLGKHVVIFVGIVDLAADAVTYANAGHFPHVIHAGGGKAEFLESSGRPVGLFDEVSYDAARVALASGDSLVALSDGVLEVMREEGLPAKEQRLVDSAAVHAPHLNALWTDIGITDGTPGPDDMTCLVVSRVA